MPPDAFAALNGQSNPSGRSGERRRVLNEHNLRACRGVVDAVALLHKDTPGAAVIVAYLAGERRPDELITSQLGNWLPARR